MVPPRQARVILATRSRCVVVFLVAMAAGTLSGRTPSRGDERLKGIACRSVHLAYKAPESVAFANEVIVDESAPGTFFCVGGFRMGYFGIQELGDGRKVAFFSVWDPGSSDDPNEVAEDRRVSVLDQGEGDRIQRFGNEGTGAQSFLDLDWSLGTRYQFLVTARAEGDRTAFTAWIAEDEGPWRLMATFATLADGVMLQGLYAFVEDFQRDRISTTKTRRARFGTAWVLPRTGSWRPLDQATFTADSNPVTNIDAQVDGPRFSLATGGAIVNEHVPLGETMSLDSRPDRPLGTLDEIVKRSLLEDAVTEGHGASRASGP